MPSIDVIVRCQVHDSFRVQQVAGMFDVPLAAEQTERFTAELPGLDEAWEIGLIVGPSGSGKSTIARRQWPAEYAVARELAGRPRGGRCVFGPARSGRSPAR